MKCRYSDLDFECPRTPTNDCYIFCLDRRMKRKTIFLEDIQPFLFNIKKVSLIDEDIKYGVIIPVRNEGNNIQYVLSSIRVQSLKPSCVIVIDDGSTDNTFNKAKKGRSL